MPGLELYHTEEAEDFSVRGSNQSGMRDRNERLVLTILRRRGALPKAEIARLTGLSAQTVSVIMRALEGDGLLEKGKKVKGKVGQPSVPMRLAPGGAYFFGLKVGRRSAELFLVNFIGEVMARRQELYRYPTPQSTIKFAKESVADICNYLTPDQISRISGLGIASPYFLWEWAAAIGIDQHEMNAWRECDLEQEIAALFDFPVYLGNDASSACGAELVFGSVSKPPDFLYLYIGFFIGGGVVLNGNLYTGRSGNAGAIGPSPILGKDGSYRQLVDVASLHGLEKRLIENGNDPSTIWKDSESWSVDTALLDDWQREAVPAISQTILSAISIIDFSHVIIDGSLPSDFRKTIIDAVTIDLTNRNLSGLIAPKILEGSVGGDARPLGAASLPLAKRFMLE